MIPHDYVILFVYESEAGSKDTISQCARCNLIRKDYEYDGGKRSPNYPMFWKGGRGASEADCPRGDMTEERALRDALADTEAEREAAHSRAVAPVPIILTCPACAARHIDEGEFATKPHHTHACQECGMCWHPSLACTFGVRFLPGFKNEEPRPSSAQGDERK